MEKVIFPPSSVYLIALLIRFTNTCWILRLSPQTSSCSMWLMRTSKLCLCSSSTGFVSVMRLSTRSGRLKSSCASVIFPLSIRAISSTSLISPNRCRLDFVILLRHSMTLSWLSIFAPAIAVRPTMAFIGVRISWDILERNSVFARFAFSADR